MNRKFIALVFVCLAAVTLFAPWKVTNRTRTGGILSSRIVSAPIFSTPTLGGNESVSLDAVLFLVRALLAGAVVVVIHFAWKKDEKLGDFLCYTVFIVAAIVCLMWCFPVIRMVITGVP